MNRAVQQLAASVFLIDTALIGPGGFGHGFAMRHVHAAIDQFPIEPDLHSMIYVVWYFVSGCVFAFGATLVWVWLRVRAGDRRPLVVATLIGVLYFGIGLFGFVYRGGDRFMAFFAVIGSVLLLTGYGMRARTPGASLEG